MKMLKFLFLLIMSASLTAGKKHIHHPITHKNLPINLEPIMHTAVDRICKLSTLLEPNHDVQASDVTYHLFTQRNKDVPEVINHENVHLLSEGNFDPKKKTVFVVHGWNFNQQKSLFGHLVKHAILEKYDFNVFVVDWFTISCRVYPFKEVQLVGKHIGEFINHIQKHHKIDGSSIIMVGYSLGAQVVGKAGAVVKDKVGHIIGLDPPFPCFPLNDTDNRLDASDGQYVEVIHTSPLSFIESMAHADFFPNGGRAQPGCGLNLTASITSILLGECKTIDGVDIVKTSSCALKLVADLGSSCAHYRVYAYFVEAIKRGPVFKAVRCSSHKDYMQNKCKGNEEAIMGQLEVTNRPQGNFYLKTEKQSPYGIN